ncbi:MAG: thiamine biosynthesis protein ApbE [Sphingomonas sp. 67-36]|nr:MAG: thiamine biosynthesis protein ApbE [Sphingomonas sp. 67-36]
MGSPCEVQVDDPDPSLGDRLGCVAEMEALRIEHKFSRYRADSVVGRINGSRGNAIALDEESAALLDYAQACWEMSGGLFDITSGILRRAWTFDGSDRLPEPSLVNRLLPHVGWHKVRWQRPNLVLPEGMEIDLGGIGKEYAVDMAIARIRAESDVPVLVNFGGDLAVTGARVGGGRWRVLIDAMDEGDGKAAWLEIVSGAITTSGDARRYVMRDGVRYGHILDPTTGYPVVGAPRSVTVAAPTCVEAGIISTLAMLRGREAERFLKGEQIPAWVTR